MSHGARGENGQTNAWTKSNVTHGAVEKNEKKKRKKKATVKPRFSAPAFREILQIRHTNSYSQLHVGNKRNLIIT